MLMYYVTTKLNGPSTKKTGPLPTSLTTSQKKKNETRELWHLTHDTWYVEGGEYSLKNSKCLPHMVWVMVGVLKILEQKGLLPTELTNEWMTKVFVEQPLLHRVC